MYIKRIWVWHSEVWQTGNERPVGNRVNLWLIKEQISQNIFLMLKKSKIWIVASMVPEQLTFYSLITSSNNGGSVIDDIPLPFMTEPFSSDRWSGVRLLFWSKPLVLDWRLGQRWKKYHNCIPTLLNYYLYLYFRFSK